MRILVSISLLIFYLAGAFHSTWTMLNFYWNRDYYIQNYCINLDAGITQCRASCYLQDLLEDRQKSQDKAHMSPAKKIQSTDFITFSIEYAGYPNQSKQSGILFDYFNYCFHFKNGVFHPPKNRNYFSFTA